MKSTIDVDVDLRLLVNGDEEGKKLTLKQFKDELTGIMGVAVVRCGHCGQWGARFCECRKCGAPIE